MNTTILLKIIELAASILKSRTSSDTDDKIDEALAIAQICQYGRQALEMQTGQSIDETLIQPKDRL